MLRRGLSIVGVLVFVAAAIWLFRSGSSGPAGEKRVESRQLEDQSAPSSDAPGPPREAPRVVVPVEGEAIDSVPASESPPRVPLPALAESDSFVRLRLESFGLPQDWTARENLVRRLAVLVDNIALGEISRRPLRFLKPADSFAVVEREGRLYADPANPTRFDSYLDLLESVDPAELARLLVFLGPLLDEAFGELGSVTPSRESILEAIDRVLESSLAPGDPELVQRKVLYEYADERLEGLPPLEKQLLRLGERGRDRLQAYLRELRAELDPGEG
jgi:hypothetical protein